LKLDGAHPTNVIASTAAMETRRSSLLTLAIIAPLDSDAAYLSRYVYAAVTSEDITASRAKSTNGQRSS
jgi:hypothetical protein